ncbi:hypothetical protein BDV93DRAFT_176259 [Ceratobasidium sp. AG-I]|nr:hypothetical protein BDV93DRAFT_176259 [Ceratobasidium sp. AG-I]
MLTHSQLTSRLRSLHPGCPIQQSCLFPLLSPPLIALSKEQPPSFSLRPLRPMPSPSQGSPELLVDVVRLRRGDTPPPCWSGLARTNGVASPPQSSNPDPSS